MPNKSRSLLMFALSCALAGCAAHSPAPVSSLNKDYDSISRGSYRGSYYEVEKGDTLYFIAYVTDRDVNEIVRYNHLQVPYTIYPGQKLKLWQPAYQPPAYAGTGAGGKSTKAAAATTAAVVTAKPIVSSKNSNQQVTKPTSSNTKPVAQKATTKGVEQSKPKEYVGSKGKQNVNNAVNKPATNNVKVTKWLWPTKGRVIKNFSSGDQGNKGIDIAGQRGQSISSTAAGTVVYSGNALRGYGNLVIIKHNDKFLSAYAHNDQLLVKEGQSVKSGQKIATMGSSGTNSVRLHFEIRYQGKSVNPKRYLP
ncbi:peptidoglycan DD-metalloendopeptidase family protein [Vibrio sp. 404]|uniref:Peptidoglycan DD-metalloendopeptidase family protein n=1 Tax=Vibrio marinisediminis TaxID=2758441 RepID=A0A7W2FU29_9VIBR|nr:peptidoglycan DD-metalloendopeptidase family protein [Vibrio marinisediminis]MBA5764266.1 peptidoglycan DD-metalloendopeptidase family protein [Vibrio marinisediminis]